MRAISEHVVLFSRRRFVCMVLVGLLSMRGPGLVNMDFSLFRKFQVTEKVNMEFKVEGFNISNTPHFGNPTGGITSANFGKILSVADDPRKFRFGLRFAF